jgi:hypothetical protein
MADRMIERERGGSKGLIGVVIGAAIVIALAFFLINGDAFRSGGSTAGVGDGAKTTAPASGQASKPASSPASGPAATGTTPASPAR